MNLIGAGMLAAAIAWFALRLDWLSASGALAALVVGGAVLAGGGTAAGILLAVFFVSSSALTKLAERRRRSPLQSRNRGGRNASQVMANGAWAALGAALIPLTESGWPILTGALAAAQADTWSTEGGAFATTSPRLVTTWAMVPPGTSGGVTAVGTLAGVVGAGAMAVTTFMVGPGAAVAVATFGSGVVGTVVDSFLGATIQARYVCDHCQVPSERASHECGHPARRLRGIAWIDNDVVNWMTTGTGGALALGMTHLL